MLVRPVEVETIFGTKVQFSVTNVELLEEFPSGITAIVCSRGAPILTAEPLESLMEKLYPADVRKLDEASRNRQA